MNATAQPSSLATSDNSSNNIALAAAILAAAAFIVATAQTVLEYASSSVARNKCAFSAIDASSKQVKLRWSWRFWRLRVYYPVLEFSVRRTLSLMMNATAVSIDGDHSPIQRIRRSHGWNWAPIAEKDNIKGKSIADAFTKLVDGSRDVSTKELSSMEYLTFLWWKIRNPSRTVIRPRASWAQLLLALGIRNTSEMRYKFEDADLIPSSFDAPVQRVKLFDLGYIALVLGFTTVKIDLPERNFEATSPFATIKTLNLPETGKILRFEGDIFAIQKNVCKGDARILVLNSTLIVAKLSFGPDFLMSGYMIPLQLLKQATTESWEEEKFDTELRASLLSTVSQNEFSAGQIGAEAFLFKDLRDSSQRSEPRRVIDVFKGDRSPVPLWQKKEPRTSTGLSARQLSHLLDAEDTEDHALEEICTQWQDDTHQTVPTILAAGALVLLNCVTIGFPSSTLIHPFLPWIRRRAKALKSRQLRYMHVSKELLQSMRMGQVLFLREIGAFWLSYNYIGLSEGKSGWIHRQVHHAYDSLDKSIQDQILIKDANGIPTGDVKVAIFPDTLVLLDKFRPTDWAAKIESILVVAVGEYRPANMLWAQILILDISIHYLVRGGWTQTDEEFQLWSKETIAVFNAVIDSWCPRFGRGASPSTDNSIPAGDTKADNASLSSTKATIEKQEKKESKLEENDASKLGEHSASKSQEKAAPESSTFTSTTKNDWEESTNDTPRKVAEWDLIGSLEKQSDLKLSEDPQKQKEKLRQLAEFLELRALLVIAFYMLSPDSSDVYAAERSEVEMPII